MIRLFEVNDKVAIPGPACYVIEWLKVFMEEEEYQEDKEYLKIYAFLFYMSCFDTRENVFLTRPELTREQDIYDYLGCSFSLEDENIIFALKQCKKMYSTSISRTYESISGLIDKIEHSISKANVVLSGKDANIKNLMQIMKEFKEMKESFEEAYKDLEEESNDRARGNVELSYDQRGIIK
jgi:hypothetical protein